ncbi:30S ribosomal protein S8 [Candidatus Kaiserbacteria bacterium]|nr:MAG: 30S ribosomal protein S8 [Candidatus Kaiserbacteria bacterium]
MVGDPIGDFIIRLKNAGAVNHDTVSIPFSKMKMAVSEVLKDHGYIKNVEKQGKKIRKTIHIELAYKEDGTHRIGEVKRVSKPGRRVYKASDELFPVRYGNGHLILSTPNGIRTNIQARKEKVGGEALFEIW